jgi:NitT/TauT family transport system substrate-binding protein
VSLVALQAGDPAGALVRGEVDAAGLFDPHAEDALRRLGARARALPAPGFFSATFNLVSVPASAGVSDENLVRLLRAARRAEALIHAEPERARRIVAAALKLDPKSFELDFKDHDFRLQLAPTLISTLEAQARWARREQLVPAEAQLPDYADFIRSGPLRRVDPRAVRLVE